MNASSLLFENLMKYNDAIQTKRSLKENVKPVKEEDETIVNLQVELPQDLEDVQPDDIKVDVGVMPIETDEDQVEEIEDEDSIEEDETEVPEEDAASDVEDEESDDDKKESLKRSRLEAFRKMKESKTCKEDDESKEEDTLEETTDFETAKKNILARASKTEGTDPEVKEDDCTGKDNCQCEACKDKKPEEKKESLARLDTTTLNHLITSFVKDNYKNIDKITISKAILENKMLTLTGTITNLEGVTESIKLVNKGFDVKKLEGKRFVMDFSDANNTFGIVTESVKKPFVFIASLKEGVLKFDSLKYNFKTKVTEGKIAKVYGKCTLTESKR